MAEAKPITDEVAEGLKAGLRGELVQPGDDGYDEARAVYNGMIDRHPRLIARCVDVADVITAVNFARDNRVLVSVRGGGHNAGGLGVCDDGLVIDLSNMKGVHVDPGARTVRGPEDARGATSTTRPTPSAWRRPAGSYRPPASAGSPLAGVSVT